MFKAHHLNQALSHEERKIYRHPLLACTSGVWKPSVEGFLFKHIISDPELIRQHCSNLSQASCGVEIEKAASVEKKRAWSIRHDRWPASRVLTTNTAREINGERSDLALIEEMHRMGQFLNDSSR